MSGALPGTGAPSHLKLKVQLIAGDEPAMGPGKAALLDAIEREGSISAAGRALGMSYRRAWLLVDSMNRCFAERLVETTAGGGTGRGARLTDAGQAARDAYRRLEADVARASEGEPLAALTRMLRGSGVVPAG